MLNESKGNMYPFVSHTWNAIKGVCPHDCSYCYMKGIVSKDMRLVESELKTDLGNGNYIFVGSSIDMWANAIPSEWILKALKHCQQYDNKYLFQTKNPERFYQHSGSFPDNTILACTIETNRIYSEIMGKAPSAWHRKNILLTCPYPVMISIEPVMDFDLETMLGYIKLIKPKFVSIGADSKRRNLPEPSPEKLKALIKGLADITKIVQKKNLSRLLK